MSAVPQPLPAANDPLDIDALETQEWLDALDAVIEREGPERAHFLLERMVEKARRSGAFLPFSATTAYVNTIPAHLEARSPGNAAYEERIQGKPDLSPVVGAIVAAAFDPDPRMRTLVGTGTAEMLQPVVDERERVHTIQRARDAPADRSVT